MEVDETVGWDDYATKEIQNIVKNDKKALDSLIANGEVFYYKFN